jgi:hypothetical protein
MTAGARVSKPASMQDSSVRCTVPPIPVGAAREDVAVRADATRHRDGGQHDSWRAQRPGVPTVLQSADWSAFGAEPLTTQDTVAK